MSNNVKFVLFLSLLSALSAPVWAQGILPGSGDVSGNIAFSNLEGIDNEKHVSFGFGAVANLSETLAVGAEYQYQPLGSVAISSVTGTEHLQTFGGVFRCSLDKSSRAVPYLFVSGGFAVLDAGASENYDILTVSSSEASQKGGYFGFGGGVSVYAGNRWGVRPEFRYERQQFAKTTDGGGYIAAFGQNDVEGLVSVFYQFGGKK